MSALVDGQGWNAASRIAPKRLFCCNLGREVEFLQTGYVAFGKQAAPIRSDTKHELRTVACAVIVEQQQLLSGF